MLQQNSSLHVERVYDSMGTESRVAALIGKLCCHAAIRMS